MPILLNTYEDKHKHTEEQLKCYISLKKLDSASFKINELILPTKVNNITQQIAVNV